MAERLGNSWHLCFWKQFKVRSLNARLAPEIPNTAFSLHISHRQMPKRIHPLTCSSSCILMGTYNSEPSNLVHPVKEPDILAPSLGNQLSYPAGSCAAQGGLTVNWQGVKSRGFKKMNRCSEKSGECWGLTTIITSESKVKKSFTCQWPFPPSHPHPAPLEVNSPQCTVSQAWVLWLRLSWCHSRKQGGHPLHQRKRHLTERGPPFSPLGSLTFPGHEKQTSS